MIKGIWEDVSETRINQSRKEKLTNTLREVSSVGVFKNTTRKMPGVFSQNIYNCKDKPKLGGPERRERSKHDLRRIF